MNRRHLLKGMGVVALYGSFPAVLGEFISSCKTKDKPLRAGFFSEDEFCLVQEISDVLMPQTATPGAVQVETPYFVDLVVKNCMSDDDQKLIRRGLQQMTDQATKRFLSLSAEQKTTAVKRIDEGAFAGDPSKAWFRIIKKLTLVGYFTSKEGMTKALNYVKIPGDYKACIPYKKGEKALAKTFLMYW